MRKRHVLWIISGVVITASVCVIFSVDKDRQEHSEVEWWEISDDRLGEYGNAAVVMRDGKLRCDVHDMLLETDTVPAIGGLILRDPNDQYYEDAMELFPYSNTFVFTYFCMSPMSAETEVLYCPACRLAREEYFRLQRVAERKELRDKIDGIGDVVNWRDERKQTLLHLAAEVDDPELVEELIGKGIDVDIQDVNNVTPLHCAAQYNSLSGAQTLITQGAKVDLVSTWGTALLLAAQYSDVEVVKLLVDKGADIHYVLDGHWSALETAKTFNRERPEVVKYLEDVGAFCDLKLREEVLACPEGDNPQSRQLIEKAIENSEYNGMKILIDKGIPIDMRNEYGDTLLHLAADSWRHDNTRIVRFLLDKGIDPNVTDDSGQTALYEAVFESMDGSNMSVIKLLIAAGADVNRADDDGNTPVSVAAIFEPELLKLILDAGGNPDSVDHAGEPIIINAVESNNVDKVKMLIEAGADLDVKDIKGQSLLEIAAAPYWKQPWELEKMIKKQGEEGAKDYIQFLEEENARIIELLEKYSGKDDSESGRRK